MIGLHNNIAAASYHADPCSAPSLSSGVARTILAKSPLHAYLDHPRLSPAYRERKPSDAMVFGSFVHGSLAGCFDEFRVIGFKDYKTAAAKTERDAAIAAGLTPILSDEARDAVAVARAVTERAAHGATNDPFAAHGRSEVTAIWEEDGVYLRARFDRLLLGEGQADLWDWKVTEDVSDRSIQRRIAEHRYDIQAAFYLRGLRALVPGCSGYASFVFVFVESKHPHCVRRVCLSEEYMAIANAEVERAIRIWRECIETGIWPGPGVGETMHVNPPAYLLKEHEENTPLIGMTKAE